MKKRNKILLFALMFTIFVLVSCFIYAGQFRKNDSVRAMSKKEKLDIMTPVETEVVTYDVDGKAIISKESMSLLNSLGENLENIVSTSEVYDRTLDRTVTRIVTDKSEIDIDNEGTIVEYKNYEDFSTRDKDRTDYVEGQPLEVVDYMITDASQLTGVYDIISTANDLSTYKQTDCSNNIEGIWMLTWNKKINEELANPYDNINVAVDAKDGSIKIYCKNTMLPNEVEPVVTREEAIELARPVFERNGITGNIDATLGFFRPNYFWDEEDYNPETFVRLSWNVNIDNDSFVQIDAITGENIGGDTKKNICGRSMFVVDFPGIYECAALGYDALNRLNYDQTNYPPVYWSITQTDINWMLSQSDMYALYLSSHGNKTSLYNSILDGNNWAVYCYDNTSFGVWRFVYLDACYTSKTLRFPNAFHCLNTGTCFVGWNVAVNIYTSLDFDERFLPRLGYMSVYDAVVVSLTESRDAGFDEDYNICDPGFAGDPNYYGWAW